MGIRTRINTIFKSNINHLVTSAEDPEKIINQSVEEMQDSFDAAKKRVLALKSEIDDSRRYKKNISEQIDYWTDKTSEFVTADMDENARQTIRKRRILEEIERKLEYRIAELETMFKEADRKIKESEGRLLAAKSKRTILLSSYGSAKTADTQSSSYAGFSSPKTTPDPYETFVRMEERINDEQQLADFKSSKEQRSFEKEESLINEELQNIKKQIKGGKK
ncbi:MAG: hypothetical protein GWO07_08610 [Candidatus Dadabacteria bacterium]|nr:hypothetical protein [Candidatus Dadabacteria bacterium]NIS08808.1 hypothetical protein [Candidatus Dadabacteria bacterium]NIY22158.1 hypothetical protein [Candidatus Dadabacteria bacterium]